MLEKNLTKIFQSKFSRRKNNIFCPDFFYLQDLDLHFLVWCDMLGGFDIYFELSNFYAWDQGIRQHAELLQSGLHIGSAIVHFFRPPSAARRVPTSFSHLFPPLDFPPLDFKIPEKPMLLSLNTPKNFPPAAGFLLKIDDLDPFSPFLAPFFFSPFPFSSFPLFSSPFLLFPSPFPLFFPSPPPFFSSHFPPPRSCTLLYPPYPPKNQQCGIDEECTLAQENQILDIRKETGEVWLH